MSSESQQAAENAHAYVGRIEPVAMHRVFFTRHALDPENPCLAESLRRESSTTRLAVFIDSSLLSSRPDLPGNIRHYAQVHNLPPVIVVQGVPGGEACKNDRTVLDSILQTMHEARLCRKSYALVIGGGAVLDVVGFAAAITHRGVRLVRMPSTTLSQADSGVGVKCGINAFGKKNALGAFAVPWSVINDTQLLTTLSPQDWRDGFSEAVKVALLKDAELLEQIESATPALCARDEEAAGAIIRRSAELHLEHIARGGDPFETGNARPLDFGHWAAHKLEQLSDFTLRHGEAVAIGLAIDLTYARLDGILPDPHRRRAIAVLRELGFSLTHPLLGHPDVLLAGLEEFREHLGGTLVLTMIQSPGTPVEVGSIDEPLMRRAIHEIAQG